MGVRAVALVFLALFLWSGPFSISVAQAALALSFALWAWCVWREGDVRRLRLPVIRPFLVFAAVTVASVFVSDNTARSVKGLRSLLLILIVYLAANLVTSERVARRLLLGLLTSVAAASLLGLYQSYTRGVDYRIRGTLSIYMTLAGIIMVALLLAVALMAAWKRRDRLVAAALAAPMALAFLFTYTRNAWVGFLVGTALLAATVVRRWAIAIGVLTIAVPLVGMIFVAPLAARIRSVADVTDATFVERVHMWRTGLRMVREHPWLGVGVKMPEIKFPEYRVPEFPRDRIAHLHSDVVHIAAERGLIGLGAWLAIWVSFFAAMARLRAATVAPSPFAVAVWAWSRAAVAAALVAGLFQYVFGDSEIVMLVYFAMGLPFGLLRPGAGNGAGDAGPPGLDAVPLSAGGESGLPADARPR